MASSDSEGAFEVQEILGQRKRKGILEYLVRWKGFGKSEDSWEPEKNLSHSYGLIQSFISAQASKKKTKTTRSRSRSRSRSRTKQTSKSRSRSRDRTSRSTSRGRGSEKKPSKAKQVDESKVEKVQETPSRQSRRLEELTKAKPDPASLNSEKTTVVTKETVEETPRLTRRSTVTQQQTEVRMVEHGKLEGNGTKVVNSTSKLLTPAASLTNWAARLWAAADKVILIVFICVTLIVFSFLSEKYLSQGFTALGSWLQVTWGKAVGAFVYLHEGLQSAASTGIKAISNFWTNNTG